MRPIRSKRDLLISKNLLKNIKKRIIKIMMIVKLLIEIIEKQGKRRVFKIIFMNILTEKRMGIKVKVSSRKNKNKSKKKQKISLSNRSCNPGQTLIFKPLTPQIHSVDPKCAPQPIYQNPPSEKKMKKNVI